MLGRNLRTTQLISIVRRMPRTQPLNKLNLTVMREQFDPRLEGVPSIFVLMFRDQL